MNERASWPESRRYNPDFEIRTACASLMTQVLMLHGTQEWSIWDDKQIGVTRTERVDAFEERDGGMQDALRVSECVYSHTTEMVAAGDVHTTASEAYAGDAPYRAFALEAGVLDTSTVDLREVLSEDYSWKAIALVIIKITEEELLDETHITLLDAETGDELSLQRSYDLYSLLESIAQELRSAAFSDQDMFDEIPPSVLHPTKTHRFATEFHAANFITGVGCDVCESEHVICEHNRSVN